MSEKLGRDSECGITPYGYSISTRNPASVLFTRREKNRESSSHLLLPSVEDYCLIAIEPLPTIGRQAQSKLTPLKRETFWIDTLSTLEPSGLNMKRCEDFTEPTINYEIVAVVVPFSRTANITSRIVKRLVENIPRERRNIN